MLCMVSKFARVLNLNLTYYIQMIYWFFVGQMWKKLLFLTGVFRNIIHS